MHLIFDKHMSYLLNEIRYICIGKLAKSDMCRSDCHEKKYNLCKVGAEKKNGTVPFFAACVALHCSHSTL